MANYEVLEPGGHAALVDGLKDYADREGGTDTEQLADGSVEMNKLGDDVLDELDSKAYADGYYAQMTVGSADNLTARGDAVEAEFMYRTSGGIADIESGNATIKSIKGNTVRWNQLCKIIERTVTSKGVTYTASASGKVSLVGTATGSETFQLNSVSGQWPTLVSGHKYVILGGSDSIGASVSILGVHAPVMFTASTSGAQAMNCIVQSTFSQSTAYEFYPQLFDLTAMFGAGSEPSTIEEFEALYPLPYYPYDAGSLLPVNMEGIETNGFNQWDEQWEVGSISDASGNNSSSSTTIRSKNYIPIFSSTTYYTRTGGPAIVVFFYDAGKTFISSTAVYSPYTVTTPANASYMRFRMSSDYGTTYKNDICINLSWSGRRDGEYEPYWKAERAIAASTYFPTGIKKAGAVFDELTADEAITRVGSVDLGTLTWTVTTSSDGVRAFLKSTTVPSNIARKAANVDIADITCAQYRTAAYYTGGTNDVFGIDKSVAIESTGGDAGKVEIHDNAFANKTASEVKTALSGVILYYELATPVTTPIDPPLNLTYKVDDWGTEKVMIPDGTVSAVPTFDIVYGMNAVDTIRRLPDLYAGKAETEAALDTKANIDGYYQQLTAGAADNLTGRGDATAGEYLFRTTAGTASVSDEGVATVKSIKGRTLRWNQLIKTVNTFSSGGLTCQPQEDSYYAVSGTVSSNPPTQYDFKVYTQAEREALFTVGHKYLMSSWSPIVTDVSTRLGIIVYNDGATYQEIATVPRIITVAAVPTTFNLRLVLSNRAGQTVDTVMSLNCFDLTAMFGAGNEPTVEEFKALYPLPYYEYDAGSLLSVNMLGVETNGFNQWDEEWEVGYISEAGAEVSTGTNWKAKNLIKVFPNTTYYFKALHATRIVFYDANGDFIKWGPGVANQTFTTDAVTHYVRFFVTNETAYTAGTVCLNLSWSGYRNGQYEPYWSDQRLIDAGTLRGAGTAYDELTETERITRVGEVALSEISWTYESNNKRFSSPVISTIVQTVDTLHPLAQTARLDVLVAGDTVYAVDGFTVASNKIWVSVEVSEPTIVTSEALNTWLAANCPTMHVALATPTVTPIDPPLNLDYRYADFGTERIMVPDGEMSAPPIIEAVYGINATDTIRNLPTDYISHASMSQFRLALMAHLGVFINETWDEVDNRYEYTITSE